MRNWEYHRDNGRNKDEMTYAEQSRFENWLEGLGLSNDSIACVLAHPELLNTGHRMVSGNPQLSLDEAIMRCTGIKQMPEETGQTVYGQPETAEDGDDVGGLSLQHGIGTIGNFIPIKGICREPYSRSVAACPFSRLPKEVRRYVECQVLGVYRDDPWDSSHCSEHDFERYSQ